MILREEFGPLIAHAGRMCLIDRVRTWDAEHIIAEADSHRDPQHPLLRGGHLAALHLCEYGAQAMAVHGALSARARGAHAQAGFVVSLREIELSIATLESLRGELVIEARRLAADRASWQYAFSVHHGGARLARGRAAILAAERDRGT